MALFQAEESAALLLPYYLEAQLSLSGVTATYALLPVRRRDYNLVEVHALSDPLCCSR